MRPVNSIYIPLSQDNNPTAPHTNTFSKNIHLVTNRESDLAKNMCSTSIMVPRYESMVLSSDKEGDGLDAYSNKDINAILNEGSQLSLMAHETHASIQNRGIFQPSASSGKGRMKKSWRVSVLESVLWEHVIGLTDSIERRPIKVLC